MTKTGFWLRILTAAATIILLLLLAGQCVALYRAGNAPDNLDASGVHLTPVFTAEKVSERLRPLLPALAGYAVLVLLTLAASAGKAPETLPPLAPENQLRLMKRRIATLPPEAQAEEKRRRQMAWLAGAGVLVCALGAMVYLLNGANFTSWELEGVMGQMLLHVSPWVVIAFALLLVMTYARSRSVKREIALLKGAPKASPAGDAQDAPKAPGRVSPIVYVLLYAAAAAFIVLGVMNGGLRDVLVKAINICTECIGLG